MTDLDQEAHGETQPVLNTSSTAESSSSSLKGVISVISVAFWLVIVAASLVVVSMNSRRSSFINFLDTRPQREILLFGDSLIGVSDSTYGLSYELENAVQDKKDDVQVFVHSSAKGGDTAFTLSARLDEDVLIREGQTPPDGVIILFDSDAADEENAPLQWYKDEYRAKLKNMISKIQEKVHYVALSGPILFGEMPDGENAKDDLLNEYEQMNKEIASQHGIDFIELRQKFFSEEPKDDNSQKIRSGKLTRDGEHPVRKGYEIIKSEFLATILSSRWEGLFQLAPGEKVSQQV